MFKKLRDKLKKWTKKVAETKPVETKEIKPPMKFNAGKQKYEPDTKEIKKQSFLKKVTSKISKVKISEKEFEVYSEELEMLLLENNVALEVAEKMIEELKQRIIGKELLKKEVESEITDCFKEIIEEILVDSFDVVEKVKEKISDQSKEPYVILFCGINGTGKTTTIAKIARFLKGKKLSCVFAAADTFRAASIEQIKKHGEKLDIKVISQEYGTDPAAVGFDAIKYAKKNFIDCVLIDTAGRMHTSKNLLSEIEKISKVCKPDLKIFVGESITGNDAIEQAKSFNWAIGIDGIVLTKADIKVISQEYGTDPAAVGFDAIKYAKKNFIDCVLIDTAGRMHTSKNLLSEIEKISKVCKPDLKIFVGESITGNDVIEQAKSFDWAIGIDGIVLTKADIDEKGGTALSVGYVTKKPILYLGTGQEYDKIIVFDKKKFIKDLGL